MVKTKITLDITNEQCRTPSGVIESAMEAAQHARATFCTQEWLRAHAYIQIHEIVAMYLDVSEIERPRVPPTISPLVGIQSLKSFFILGLLCARKHSCWCPACSRTVSRDSLTLGWGGVRCVPDCTHKHLTVWREKPRLISTAAKGIANEREYRKDLWSSKLRSAAKPGKFAYVQADTLWSESERKHLSPGHARLALRARRCRWRQGLL